MTACNHPLSLLDPQLAPGYGSKHRLRMFYTYAENKALTDWKIPAVGQVFSFVSGNTKHCPRVIRSCRRQSCACALLSRSSMLPFFFSRGTLSRISSRNVHLPCGKQLLSAAGVCSWAHPNILSSSAYAEVLRGNNFPSYECKRAELHEFTNTGTSAGSHPPSRYIFRELFTDGFINCYGRLRQQ